MHQQVRQFLLTEPGAVTDAHPSPLAPWLLALSADGKTGRAALLLDTRGGAVHPEGSPVEFTPADEGSEPFLPWLVDRVRNLPFVGPSASPARGRRLRRKGPRRPRARRRGG
jgi:hypothetical protein